MVIPSAGTVVLIPYPFTDLTNTKLRPAVVLADAGRGDIILRQITSNRYADARAVETNNMSFASGGLRLVSFARPTKLFTGDNNLIVKELGTLTANALTEGIEAVINLLNESTNQP